MQNTNGDLLQYQVCAAIDGSIHKVNWGKRNGLPVPLLTPALTDYSPMNSERDGDIRAENLFKQLSGNLTKVERRTWRKLLVEGKSIAQVAIDEGVSRNAVYERIRGNSKGQGGMIAKNDFVALWWLRRSLEENENLD
jgi:hypothetical protein